MSTHPLHRWPAPKTFGTVGDEIKGTVIAWDGSDAAYPSLHIRTADGLIRIVRVTQARLHERLAELLPDPGDRIWIRYDGESKRSVPGMNPTKEFTVEIRRADSRPSADGTGSQPPENGQGAGT